MQFPLEDGLRLPVAAALLFSDGWLFGTQVAWFFRVSSSAC